jgi:oligopeptide transport system substrate-binding protein
MKKSLLPALAGLVLISCSDSLPPADFTFINGSEPQSLDPGLITGQSEGRICRTIFEGLTRYAADGSVVAGAAESWELNPEQTIYTFHLRPGLKWSDGRPLTALDFRDSWKRVLTPETAAEYAYIMDFIKNAQAYRQGDLKDFSQVGIKAIDERTLEVTLNAPTPFFLNLTAFPTYYPVPLWVIEAHGDAWALPENIVTNGAYLLADWRIRDRVVMIKNHDYWDAHGVQLNRIDSLITDSATTAFNLYATGMADLIMDKGLIPQHIIGQLKHRPDFHTYTYLGTYYYRFNVTQPPLDDKRVRIALSAAIDKERVVNKITRAGEQPAHSLTPPGIESYVAPQGVPYDPERARQLLAEAGFPNGDGFPRLSILYNTSELHKEIAIEIQAMWREVLNIRIDLQNQDWSTYLDNMNKLEYSIARSGWIGDYPDPNTFLDCFITGGGNNRTGWSRKEYDEAIALANRTCDPDERSRIFHDAEILLVREDPPILPLYHYLGILFYDADRIKGIIPNLLAEHPLTEIYIEEGHD